MNAPLAVVIVAILRFSAATATICACRTTAIREGWEVSRQKTPRLFVGGFLFALWVRVDLASL